MPPKRSSSASSSTSKKLNTGANALPNSSSLSTATLPPMLAPNTSTPAASLSEYDKFLRDYVAGKAPAKFSQTDVSGWPKPSNDDKGRIVNEIAKKFNNQQRLGISEVNSNPGRSDATYGIKLDPQTNPLGDPVLSVRSNPDPSILGHELVHANDHQIDNLNAGVWHHLERLHTDSGSDSKQYGNSVNKIKNLIDPSKTFSQMYKTDLTRGPLVNDINRWKTAYNVTPAFAPPQWSARKGADNWSTTFPEVNAVVTDPDPASTVQNRPFLLGGPSEFPAFMSENLTRPWGANSGANPLSLPEARFLHSTLGDMGTAYPAVHPATAAAPLTPGAPAYPTMNQHIMARRNSLEQAYYPGTPGVPGTPGGTAGVPGVPPGLQPGQAFARGGRVTNKNLLLRFKKTRHKLI